VTLPQIRPAIISAAFLSFIASFDELVIAMFLGGSNWTLPKKMFDNIQLEIEPTVAAVSVLQIVLVTIILLLAARFGTGVTPVSSEPPR
jgi:ABC-type spermidine/putrescine transport system permease subunit II